MAPPSVLIDPTADFSATTVPGTTASPDGTSRTLILCPPSLASHPAALNTALAPYDRALADIQMLDRLALDLVPLPADTYGAAVVVADTAAHVDARDDAHGAFARPAALRAIFGALKPGAELRSHCIVPARMKAEEAALGREGAAQAILAGFVVEEGTIVKPLPDAGEAVPLRFGKKMAVGANGGAAPSLGKGNGASAGKAPAGVGFVNGADDTVMLDEDDDDALIDENTLLDEEDLASNITQRTFCIPFCFACSPHTLCRFVLPFRFPRPFLPALPSPLLLFRRLD